MLLLNQINLKKIYYPAFIFIIFSFGLSSDFSQEIFGEEENIPSWIKIIAVWWGDDKITDEEFINTFQYLVENKIIEVPLPLNVQPTCSIGLVFDELTNECVIHDETDTDGIFIRAIEEQQKTIVSLIKTTTFWWGEGKIADEDFIDALQYLVENNVLKLEPEKQPVVQPKLKPLPKDLIIWPKIDRIGDFKIQGHSNIDKYQLQLKLVDSQSRSLDPDGTLSIVIMDDRKRILYLDAFSIRKTHYVDSFPVFSEGVEGDKIYSWEIKNSDIRPGFTPYGKAKIVFTDKFGLKFFSEYDKVSIPQFN